MTAILNNLPVPLSSFIGRERETGEVSRLVASSRLVTLTGAGGVGKTRLSLQVAAAVLESFKDGVWFIDLAPFGDPALIPQAILASIGLHEQAGQSILTLLGDFFHARTILLILDNCEHLIAECAQVTDTLLRAAPALHILATSREALNIAGELAWRVPSLQLPTTDSRATLQLPMTALTQYEATQLFVARALFALPAFRVTEANAPLIAQICVRLDGIPLAIELAAARVRALSVEQIAARLDDRFHLLTGGSRTELPRHQTLRALIDWSWELLPEQERVLLRRLSVFAGGWTIEAAEAVCGDGDEVEARHASLLQQIDVLDVLTHLVDKSLAVMEQRVGTQIRYRLLETIRQFACEKLDEAGETAQWRDRHLDFFMRLAEEAELKIESADQVTWFNRLETELGNLRAAIARAVDSHQAEAGLRLSGALLIFWLVHGSLSETCERIGELLALPEASEKTAARARALSTAGQLQALRGQNAISRTLSEEALRLGQEFGDQRTVAWALENFGTVSLNEGDDGAARLWFERSAHIRRASGDSFNLGAVLAMLAELAVHKSQYAEAKALLVESLAMLRAVDAKFVLAIPLRLLSRVALHEGDYRQAIMLSMESLLCNFEIKDKLGGASSLAAVAEVVRVRGDLIQAAHLLGAVEALLTSMHLPMQGMDRAEYNQSLARLRAQLDDATFERAWNEGCCMTLEQAVAEAERFVVGLQTPTAKPRTFISHPAGLTEREVEVLRWLVQGLTDAQIAEALVISRRTVHAHLRSIYGKLDVTTRNAAVQVAIEGKLL